MIIRMSTTSQPTAKPLPTTSERVTERVLKSIRQHEMTAPAVLFLTSHRPLGFVLGQMLHVATPMADLLGWSGCDDWAVILSDPDGLATLEQALDHGSE